MKIAELVFRREGQLAKQAGSARPFFMPLSMKTLSHFRGPRRDVFFAGAVAPCNGADDDLRESIMRRYGEIELVELA